MRNVNEDIGRALELASRIADSLDGISESLAFIQREIEEHGLGDNYEYPESLEIRLGDDAAHEIRQLTRAVERMVPSRQI